ncbi:MAG: DUF2089 family protein [Verrucomicrobiota bacterium]
MSKSDQQRWLDDLSDEDLAFIKRLVLASGSLKELAKGYGITYPTIRIRLNRLIAKIEALDSETHRSDFERRARVLFADGKIDADTLRQLLESHYEELDSNQSR